MVKISANSGDSASEFFRKSIVVIKKIDKNITAYNAFPRSCNDFIYCWIGFRPAAREKSLFKKVHLPLLAWQLTYRPE